MTAPPGSLRVQMTARLARLIEECARPHPVRVAIDGPDAAGKTTLADELAGVLRASGREVVRASVDDFHRPRSHRYRRDADSPAGYYEDAFDRTALRTMLLDPLGPGGGREYRRAHFDLETDERREEPPARAGDNAIVVVDGVFLAHPDLRAAWDVRVFVSITFDEVLRRALVRDVALFGSAAEVERRYRTRYLPGQRLYVEAERPAETADAVVDNNDPSSPTLRLAGGSSLSRSASKASNSGAASSTASSPAS